MRQGWWLGLMLWARLAGAADPETNVNPAMGPWLFGGNGQDGDFTYNGEGAGGCGGAVCALGTCSGTAPNGTCTLDLVSRPSAFLRTANESGDVSVVREYGSFTMTGGTLTIGGTPGVEGSALMIAVQSDATITGGTITMKGKGGAPATGGTCVASNAGKPGGSTKLLAGGLAGAAGATAGGAGNQQFVSSYDEFPWMGYQNGIGTGGGACAAIGQSAAHDVDVWRPALGGTGGGGGGCAGACVGTCGAGGRGGGMMLFSVAGQLTFGAGATIDVRGNAGASGGGGGGGGGMAIFEAHALAGGSPTTLVTGGAAGGTPPTNCGNGGSGGDGAFFAELAPL